MKKTEWFNGRNRKPARPGVYERKKTKWYSMWTGKHWKLGSKNIETAARETRDAPRWVTNDRWRGLRTEDGK